MTKKTVICPTDVDVALTPEDRTRLLSGKDILDSQMQPTKIENDIVITSAREAEVDDIGYMLTASMEVDLPIGMVFNFFSDAMNLEAITPPWLHFSVLTPKPIEMRAGLLLDYQLYLHRIPIRWRTEISEWEPPYRFVDQQLKGPYKRWHHEHTFEEIDGKTVVHDRVHYIPRGGALIHRWFVKPDLLKIFNYRQQTLREVFAATQNELSKSVSLIDPPLSNTPLFRLSGLRQRRFL